MSVLVLGHLCAQAPLAGCRLAELLLKVVAALLKVITAELQERLALLTSVELFLEALVSEL